MGQQAYANESQLKAQLIAGRFTNLAAGISSLVTAVEVKDGELVESGAALILFDCDGLKASKAIAKAHIDAANAQFNSLSKLRKLNSASALEVTLAATEQAIAEGELDSVTAKIKYCIIKAPYQSRVVARHIQPYQYVEPGTELLHIYDPSSLEVQFVAPSSLLSQLSGNKGFSIHLDELDIDLTGNIIRTGGQIDPVSQTIKVYGQLDSHPTELLEGMSGFVTLQP
ncbi:MAG: HlyD family efflux transporter periplasmic adaptor subunit [Olleya sp.]